MFHPPVNVPHAAVAYRTTALDARRQDRVGGPGWFFKIYIIDDCQIIENNNSNVLWQVLGSRFKATLTNRTNVVGNFWYQVRGQIWACKA
jgi:hypothetical protein